MIVWGTSGKKDKISEGEFYCPNCQTRRPYAQWQVGKYFDVFWIKLFKVGEAGGPFVECQVCKEAYRPSVLEYEPPTPGEQFLTWVVHQLANGMPLHMLHEKLIDDGLDEQTITEILAIATEGKVSKCSGCGFEYSAEVTRCPNCGGSLKTADHSLPITQQASIPSKQPVVEPLLLESKSEPKNKLNFCGKCGSKIGDDWSQFCANCGARLQ